MSHIVELEWNHGSRIHNKITTFGGQGLHFAEILTGRDRFDVNREYGDRPGRDRGEVVIITGKHRGYPDVKIRRVG